MNNTKKTGMITTNGVDVKKLVREISILSANRNAPAKTVVNKYPKDPVENIEFEAGFTKEWYERLVS